MYWLDAFACDMLCVCCYQLSSFSGWFPASCFFDALVVSAWKILPCAR